MDKLTFWTTRNHVIVKLALSAHEISVMWQYLLISNIQFMKMRFIWNYPYILLNAQNTHWTSKAIAYAQTIGQKYAWVSDNSSEIWIQMDSFPKCTPEKGEIV